MLAKQGVAPDVVIPDRTWREDHTWGFGSQDRLGYWVRTREKIRGEAKLDEGTFAFHEKSGRVRRCLEGQVSFGAATAGIVEHKCFPVEPAQVVRLHVGLESPRCWPQVKVNLTCAYLGKMKPHLDVKKSLETINNRRGAEV